MRGDQCAAASSEPSADSQALTRVADLRAAEDEVRAGKCTARHAAELQGALQSAKSALEASGPGSSEWFTLTTSDVLVATPQGTLVPQENFLGGEFHIFAISRGTVTLEANDGHGNASALRSPWERLLLSLAADAHLDSKVAQTNRLHDETIRVAGKGCVLVMVFEKH